MKINGTDRSICVSSVTIPSLEDAVIMMGMDNEMLKLENPCAPGTTVEWWLTAKGDTGLRIMTVDENGTINSHGLHPDESAEIRPVLRISSLGDSGLVPGNNFTVNGWPFLLVDYNFAVCRRSAGCSAFRNELMADNKTDYEKSSLKKNLKAWAERYGIKADEQPVKENGGPEFDDSCL